MQKIPLVLNNQELRIEFRRVQAEIASGGHVVLKAGRKLVGQLTPLGSEKTQPKLAFSATALKLAPRLVEVQAKEDPVVITLEGKPFAIFSKIHAEQKEQLARLGLYTEARDDSFSAKLKAAQTRKRTEEGK